MNNKLIAILILSIWIPCVQAEDFFNITQIHYRTAPGKNVVPVLKACSEIDAHGRKNIWSVFRPNLEVTVTVGEKIRTDNLIFKTYFFDKNGKQLCPPVLPAKANRKNGYYGVPPFLLKETDDNIYFAIPESLTNSDWTAMTVVGDTNQVAVQYYPSASDEVKGADFPEKTIFLHPHSVDRKADVDSIVEEVVRTDNTSEPKITLLMRLPHGVSKGGDVKGVLALSLLANSVDEIKNALLDRGHQAALIRFADEHKLAIIAWGARRAWKKAGSYYQLNENDYLLVEHAFDEVADAWESGVKSLIKDYGIPKNDYLFSGSSMAANWAHRLALRKPDYFAAIHVDLLTTHDQPRPEGKRIMWLMTTGEMEGGYKSSLLFYKACKDLGYPIIYKAYPHFAHQTCESTGKLELEFFKFALEQIEESKKPPLPISQDLRDYFYQKRMGKFLQPSFYGDIINQEDYPPDQVEMIPKGYRVALPTKPLADAWMLLDQ